MGSNVCGWISNVLYKNRIVGWLLNPSETDPRDAIVEINDFALNVRCNEVRNSPKKYKTHVNNGFSILIDDNIYPHLNHKNIIKLIDKSTNKEIAKSVIKIDLALLKKSFRVGNVSCSNVKKDSDVFVSTQASVIGKLNSTFNNFKI